VPTHKRFVYSLHTTTRSLCLAFHIEKASEHPETQGGQKHQDVQTNSGSDDQCGSDGQCGSGQSQVCQEEHEVAEEKDCKSIRLTKRLVTWVLCAVMAYANEGEDSSVP